MTPFKELLEELSKNDKKDGAPNTILNLAGAEALGGLNSIGTLFEKCQKLKEPLSNEEVSDIGSLIKGLSDIAEFCRMEAQINYHALKKKGGKQ